MAYLRTKESGITLLVLVITIVILLILTGVTLSLTIGNNGLITKTAAEKDKWESSEKEEILQSAVLKEAMDGTLSAQTLEQELNSAIPGGFGSVSESNNEIIVTISSEVVYKVWEDGTIIRDYSNYLSRKLLGEPSSRVHSSDVTRLSSIFEINIEEGVTAILYDHNERSPYEDYIEYNKNIYKVTYSSGKVAGIVLTNIDINDLGRQKDNALITCIGRFTRDDYWESGTAYTTYTTIIHWYNEKGILCRSDNWEMPFI